MENEIKILYINKKNQKRCNDWYTLLNFDGDLSAADQLRLDELDKEFQGKAFVFSEYEVDETTLSESKRNEIIQAFVMITNYENTDAKTKRYFRRRFKYMFDNLIDENSLKDI